MRQGYPNKAGGTGFERERSALGGLLFVVLLAAALVAVSYPAATLGVGLGVLIGLGLPTVVAAVRQRRATPPVETVDPAPTYPAD